MKSRANPIISLLRILFLIMLGLQIVIAQEQDDQAMDEEAIKKVLATYVETWN